MKKNLGTKQSNGAKAVKDIRRPTRRQYSVGEKNRIVLDDLKGEGSIAELCRRQGIVQSRYFSWSEKNPPDGFVAWIAPPLISMRFVPFRML